MSVKKVSSFHVKMKLWTSLHVLIAHKKTDDTSCPFEPNQALAVVWDEEKETKQWYVGLFIYIGLITEKGILQLMMSGSDQQSPTYKTRS